MKYISTLEASKKWGISQRRVRILCQNGQIPNCVYIGKSWQIPEDAQKPIDKRTVDGKKSNENLDYLYLMLNALYADNISNPNKDERMVCDIQKTMLSGELDKAYDMVKEYIKDCSNDGYLLVAVSLQFILAFYLGKRYKQTELFVKYRSLLNDERMFFMNQYLNISLNRNVVFKEGEAIPENMLPQLLYRTRRNTLYKLVIDDIFIDPPFLEVSSASLDKCDNEEIIAYGHILLAQYYNFFNKTSFHNFHVKKALEIIIKHKWYLMIAEHGFSLDWHLENYLDSDELEIVNKIEKYLCNNLLKGSTTRKIVKKTTLDPVILVKIAYQIAANKTNEQIADYLSLSLYQVKKYVNEIYRILGIDNRKEIGRVFTKELMKI